MILDDTNTIWQFFCLSDIIMVLILAILTRPSMLSSYDKGANKLEKKFYKICSRFFSRLRVPSISLRLVTLTLVTKKTENMRYILKQKKKIFFWAEKKMLKNR